MIPRCTRRSPASKRSASRKSWLSSSCGQAMPSTGLSCISVPLTRATNVRRTQAYCWFAVQKNCVPIATHLLFPQFMDDTDPAQRQQALFMSRLLLTKCNEVWVFGETISQDMASEIRKAESRNKTIRYFTKDCQEVQASCEN